MYKCPECEKEMIWQSDNENDEGIDSIYSCDECEITLYKTYKD